MIAAYAVKLNLDSEHPQEVATFDESKAEALRVVFLDMHELSLMFGFFLFYRDIINNIKAGKENEIQRMVKRLVRALRERVGQAKNLLWICSDRAHPTKKNGNGRCLLSCSSFRQIMNAIQKQNKACYLKQNFCRIFIENFHKSY